MYFCLKLPSASSWGCELKYVFTRSINISKLSASSWGCELKYWHEPHVIHPHRVSLFVRLWVEIPMCVDDYIHEERQPLREAVSWNNIVQHIFESLVVSLFVRLWVEITDPAWTAWDFQQSASSWGCELKYRIWRTGIRSGMVSLFVRLWVEISILSATIESIPVSLFVRLWVEILIYHYKLVIYVVSLFVRLWVEIYPDHQKKVK